MTLRVGYVAVPFGFVLACIGYAVLTRRPDLPYVNVSFIGNR